MDVPTRLGGHPNESIQQANAQGKTVVGASAPSQWRSWAHLGLGLLEFVPVPLVSGAAGAVDAGMYVQEGNYGDAALAAGSVIPFEKWAAAGAKGVEAIRAARAAKTAEEAAKAEKAAKEAKEAEEAEKAAKDGESVKKDKRGEGEDCSHCAMYPVILHSGAKITFDTDFSLPGALTIELVRSYASDMDHEGPLGRNRIGTLDEVLTLEPDGSLLYRMGSGRTARFERPSPNPGMVSRDTRNPYLALSVGRRGSFFLRDRGETRHFTKFKDSIWRLGEVRDLNDHHGLFTRDAAGVLTRLDRSDGFSFLFENDVKGLRTSATLRAPTGETRLISRYGYDEAGNLIEARNSYAPSFRYEYDAAHRLVAYDDGVKVRCEYTFDKANRVVMVKTPGSTFDHTISYESGATTLAYTARPDAVTRYEFDRHGKTLRETNGLGHVRTYERNEAGIVLAEIDAEGNRTSYGHDAFGNRSTVTDPEGRRTTYVYDVDGRLERLIDPAGNAWEWSYDPRGNLVSAEDPLDYRTDFANDAAGQPTGVMRHDGLIEHRSYDSQHRLVRVVDYRGGVTLFSYDGFGRMVATTDPLGRTTHLAYDEQLGADFWTAAVLTRPDGVVVRRDMDPALATSTTVDGAGRRTVYHYGPFGLLHEIEDPQGSRLRFAYNHERQVIGVENQIGRAWTYQRDNAGRVLRETDFNGLVTTYAYDRADRMIERQYADGSRLTFKHDRSGLLLLEQAWEPAAATPSPSSRWYDERGLLAGAENDAACITFERDASGRVTTETNNGRRIKNTYDCCGRRTERRIGASLVQTEFDPVGAHRRIAIDDHAPLTFQHDLFGRELRRASAAGFQLNQAWDDADQLLRQWTGDEASRVSHPAVDRSFVWDRSLAPVTIRDRRWGETFYALDGNGQVTDAHYDGGGIQSFFYDPALNISASGDESFGFLSWTTSLGGRVVAARGPSAERITLTYDARGRAVERRIDRDGFRPQSWRYSWNARGLMVGCENPSGETWVYRYDPFARRLSKSRLLSRAEEHWVRSRHPDAKLDAALGSALDVWPERPKGASDECGHLPAIGTQYLWDEDVVAEEAPLMVGGTANWDAATRWYYEPSSFQPFAQLRPDGSLLYIVTNHIGTPREALIEVGRLVWAAEEQVWGSLRQAWIAANENDSGARSIEPFGSGRTWGELALRDDPKAAAAAELCPIRFQGQWEDRETGLSYNRFRHYDALAASYLSPDPLGLIGGIRPYAYVTHPGVWIDPLGLAPKTYQTYTKPNPTGGAPYVGRTSGCCSPEKNVANRDRNHQRNDQGYGPAELDKSSSDPSAIRGREQQMIDANGGAQSQGGTSSNAINGISPNNPKGPGYLGASTKAFGN